MRVLLIGGTGFIGPHICNQLLNRGHEIAVFHRGVTSGNLPAAVQHILGDSAQMETYRDAFAAFNPEIVVDLIAADEQHASALLRTFQGLARRTIVLSSGDVYRAHAVLWRKDDGPVEPVPLTEEATLRRNRYQYRGRSLPLSWVNPDTYEKIDVETIVAGEPGLPTTILRLPFIYGAGDYVHRFHPYIKRMRDGRSYILLDSGTAAWRAPWGYVENVAGAVVCAVEQEHAAGRTYNVAEAESLTVADWIDELARIIGWRGRVVITQEPAPPPNLSRSFNTEQHLFMASTRIREELNYREHVSRQEALRCTAEWEDQNPPVEINEQLFDYAAEDEIMAAQQL